MQAVVLVKMIMGLELLQLVAVWVLPVLQTQGVVVQIQVQLDLPVVVV